MLDALLAVETDPGRKKELDQLKHVAQGYPYSERANVAAKLNDKVREMERDMERDGMPKEALAPLKQQLAPLKQQVEEIGAQLVAEEDEWLKAL